MIIFKRIIVLDIYYPGFTWEGSRFFLSALSLTMENISKSVFSPLVSQYRKITRMLLFILLFIDLHFTGNAYVYWVSPTLVCTVRKLFPLDVVTLRRAF